MLGNDLFINYLLPHNVLCNYDMLLITLEICSIVRIKIPFCILPNLFHNMLNSSRNYTFYNQLFSIQVTKAYVEWRYSSTYYYHGEKFSSRSGRLAYR